VHVEYQIPFSAIQVNNFVEGFGRPAGDKGRSRGPVAPWKEDFLSQCTARPGIRSYDISRDHLIEANLPSQPDGKHHFLHGIGPDVDVGNVVRLVHSVSSSASENEKGR
jgi:hypothetical protein